jgi:hypothetical protein
MMCGMCHASACDWEEFCVYCKSPLITEEEYHELVIRDDIKRREFFDSCIYSGFSVPVPVFLVRGDITTIDINTFLARIGFINNKHIDDQKTKYIYSTIQIIIENSKTKKLDILTTFSCSTLVVAAEYYKRVMDKISSIETMAKLPQAVANFKYKFFMNKFVSFESALSIITIVIADKYLMDVPYSNIHYYEVFDKLTNELHDQIGCWKMEADIESLEAFNEFECAVLWLLDFKLSISK